MAEISGLLSALITPFQAGSETVDEAGLRSLVDRHIAEGIHGLVPCGSTGEFAAMTAGERRRVVEVVIDEAAGRVPVVAHVGAMTTAEAVAHARHAEDAGAAGLMAVAPYYEPLSVAETKAYFRSVADAVQIPIVIYNLPVATGVDLPIEDLLDLARRSQNITHVKDTTGDLSRAARLIHDHGDEIKTFVGWDTMYFASLVEGAPGSILGATNFLTPQLAAIWDAVREGRVPDARVIWDDIFPVMQFLISSGGYVQAVRGGLDIVGRPAGPPRAPMQALAGERRSELEQLIGKLAT
jgi:4-hydroxy-tetrahydrodipicolinate synthase